MSKKKINLTEQMDACKRGLDGFLDTGAAVAAMFAKHDRDKEGDDPNIMNFSIRHGLDPVQHKIIKSIVYFQKTNDIGHLYTAQNYLNFYAKNIQKTGEDLRWKNY